MRPAKLYRYRSLGGDSPIQRCKRERQEKVVFDGHLYFPSRIQFNDPFDCIAPSLEGIPRKCLEEFIDNRALTEPTESSLAEREEIARQLKQNPSEEIPRMTQELADFLGILSLSEKRDNILMWSHYANSHQGFCLEFDISTAPFDKARHVHYRRDRYAYDFANVAANAENLLLTKYEDWKYEEEWRIIADKGGELYRFPPEALTGVIFGCRMSETSKRKVILWINRSSCKPLLYQATIRSRDFGLDIVRC
jgi:hypothetical protein